jgi:transposase
VLTRQQLYELYYQGPQPTLLYIEALLAELADFERRFEERQDRLVVSQRHYIEKLSEQLKRAKEKLWRQEALNYQLKRRVAELEAAAVVKDSHNSSLPPSTDGPAAKAANSVRRTRSLRRPSRKRPGAQAGHPGHTRAMSEQPDRVVTHAPRECRGCGASLASGYVVRCERRQVIDLPPIKPWVVEHRALTKRCATCDALTKGRFPKEIKAAVQYGSGVRARAVYLVNYQLLPYRRASELLRDFFSCLISPGSLRPIIAECSARALLTEVEIKNRLKQSEVIHVDETGLRVEGEGRFVHVASTAGLTHYSCDRRRGKPAMDEVGILPVFKGISVHDGWPAYSYYYQCQHALCGAHLLRELTYIEESNPHQRGEWAEPMAKLLVEIKEAVEQARVAGWAQLGQEEQAEFRRRYERIVKRGVELNPERTTRRAVKGGASGKAERGRIAQTQARKLVARLAQYQTEVLRFMTDFRVPFDNNQAERDLRMVKLQQKVSGCFRTGEGAREFCRLRSVISTARKQGQGVLESIEKVLRRQPLTLTS